MNLERTPPDFPIPRVALEGTVLAAEDGRPIAGAKVTYYFDPEVEYLRDPESDSPVHPFLEVESVRTDAQGKYRLDGIPYWPGAPRKVGAEAPGRFPSSRTIEFAREGESLRVDLRLGKGGILRGTVRMADGTPVGGATVHDWGPPPTSASGERRDPWEHYRFLCHRILWRRMDATSGPQGRYEVSPLPRGAELRLSISSSRGSARGLSSVRVPEESGEAVLDFILEPTGKVEIHLVPGKGPLPDAVHLDVRPAGSPGKPGRWKLGIGNLAGCRLADRTDTMGALPPGRYFLVARATNPRGPGGQRRTPITVRAGKTTVVRVVLPPADSPRPWKAARGERFPLDNVIPHSTGSPKASVAGVVLDAATGLPVKGALVSDIWRPRTEHLGAHRSGWESGLEAPPVRTDPRGLFRLPGLAFEAGVSRKVLVEAEGYWTTARTYEFRCPGEVRPFRFRLRRAGVLRGTVRDPEGRPMPRAEIIASVQRKQPDDWQHRYSQACTDIGQVGMVRTATDEAGRYALSPLPFDRWLEVHAGNGTGKGIPRGLYFWFREDHPEEVLDFVIDPGGALAVEVLPPPGRALGDVRMRLQDAAGGTVYSSGWNCAPGMSEVGRLHRNVDEGLPPGGYRLSVSPKGFAAPGSPFAFRIRRGKTTTVRVRTVVRPKRRKGK